MEEAKDKENAKLQSAIKEMEVQLVLHYVLRTFNSCYTKRKFSYIIVFHFVCF